MSSDTNRQWVLASRPTGEPTGEDFEMVDAGVPEPGPKEVLVRTQYMSVDPYMRGRMRDADSYADPWGVGDAMRARCVGEVVESNHTDFAAGDTVTGNLYWAEYAAVDGEQLAHADTGSAPVSTALHVLGMPGRTAYVGTVDIGEVEPGDTVVVSGAAGAVGSVAGQVAAIAGARVVGIAGSDRKADEDPCRGVHRQRPRPPFRAHYRPAAPLDRRPTPVQGDRHRWHRVGPRGLPRALRGREYRQATRPRRRVTPSARPTGRDSAGAQGSAASGSTSSASRSLNFWTFPLGFFGSSSTK